MRHYAVSLVYQQKREGGSVSTFNCLYSTWAKDPDEALRWALEEADRRVPEITKTHRLIYNQELELPCVAGDQNAVEEVVWPEELDA